MRDEINSALATLQREELTPFVALVLGRSEVEITEWHVQRLKGGGSDHVGGGLGIYRLIGIASDVVGMHPWTLIVKILSGSSPAGSSNPSDWNYLKREVFAYQSGILAQLPGNLVAPRCYGVTEHVNDEWRIWLEDIQETPKIWTLDRHGLAARHLGQFNGAYLAGYPLPTARPWLWKGRTRNWLELCQGMIPNFQQNAQAALNQRWLTSPSVERIFNLWAHHQTLLERLERLPLCLCHHDAFRRNLLARDTPNASQTVAIDWSYIGYGGVGQEIGLTTAIALSWLEVPGSQAQALDKLIFDGYVAGLQDAGWAGDIRLARFGYTATAALVTGLVYTVFASSMLETPEGREMHESIVGHSLDEIVEQWAITQPFLLNLGDEAFDLLAVIG